MFSATGHGIIITEGEHENENENEHLSQELSINDVIQGVI